MTEKEWQERYEITSLKGRIWKRSEIAKRAMTIAASLAADLPPPVIRTAVRLVLDDPEFMRSRRGMVPARVIEDAAMEAFLRLRRQEGAS